MLKNKNILITGSSRGIGAATARLAQEYGAKVILHGRTDSEELRALARELDASYVVCDVSDREATEKAFASLEPDVLVNNAGVNPSKKFLELTDEDWRRIFEVNVFGVANASRAVLPAMQKRQGGTIVNIASVKGHQHVVGKPAYAASKAAVMRLTTSMAQEFASDNIRVNAVAPGFVETKMTASTLSPQIEAQIARIPLGRIATPQEIAEVVVFLAGTNASYITGQTVTVDGGFSIGG